MTVNKPTMRDIRKGVKNDNFIGWNDKRKNYNRIKLTRNLTENEKKDLRTYLESNYPNYVFAVSEHLWHMYSLYPRVVTTIKFHEKH